MLYLYINVSHGETFESNATRFSTDAGICDPEGLARDAAAAEDNFLGPAGNWPLDLQIFANGESLGTYHIERIPAPTFIVIPCTEETP